MELREGYKQTEIGEIPEDWSVVTVGDISSVKTGPFGSALHEKDYVDEGTPIITVEHIGERGVLHRNLPKVSDTDRDRLSAYILKVGDVVFSRVGSVDRNALICEPEAGWLFSGRLLRVRPSQRSVNPSYLSYHFHSEDFKQRVRDIAVGQTMASINTQILKGVLIVIAPAEDQKAIAEALSDADALIESLEQLIAKKRQIKQGAMQELLTGKKRLPGFGGEWEVKRLSEVCWFQEGPGVRNYQFTSTGVKLFNGTNIEKGQIDLDKTDRYISEKEAYGCYSHFLADAGDIVIACSGITIDKFDEKVALLESQHIPLCMNTSTMRFKVKQGRMCVMYLLQLLASSLFKEQIGGSATGSAQLNFGPSHVSKVSVPLPQHSEQTAIAEILSDMDAEIGALDTKLCKARQVKQGMMQELLTGNTGLV